MQPSPRANISCAICFGSLCRVAIFAQLDEVGVLGEAASVEVQRDTVLPAYVADGARVFHRNRLASAGVVGHRQHDQRNALPPNPCDQVLERADVHVPLERMPGRRLAGLGDRNVHRFCADKLNVGAGSVEVRIVGDDVSLLAHHAEQNALGGATLVRRDHVPIAEDVLHRITKVVEAAAAGVALVTHHHRSPLPRGHRTGARVGEQVNQHIVGGQQEQVVMRGAQ